MPENRKVIENHGCIVCAKLFNVLAVYAPDNRMMDCKVTGTGGHIVPDKRQPLVVCNTHSAEEIESAYKRWKSRNGKEFDHEQEEE
jgi:hypothetical protein